MKRNGKKWERVRRGEEEEVMRGREVRRVGKEEK